MNEVIKNIDKSSINEILQDVVFICVFKKFVESIKNPEAKRYFSMFVKDLSIIYLYELSVFSEDKKILSKDELFKSNIKKKIREERNSIHRSIYQSNTIKEKSLKMGIEMNEKVYDINIVIDKNNKLLDINLENYNEEDKLKFWNDIVYTNEKIAKELLKDITGNSNVLDWVYNVLNEKALDKIQDLEDIFIGFRYSYSSYELFKNFNSFTDDDKYFVMYRYRLLYSIICIDNFFKKYPLELKIGDISNLEIKNYILKIKSLIIDILGNDILKLNTDFVKKIRLDIKKEIEDHNPDFFMINRKIRNNIHYSNIETLQKKDMERLEKNQNKYLTIIMENFKSSISININSEVIMLTNFLKLCNKKGLTENEMIEHYEENYKKFYYTGDF